MEDEKYTDHDSKITKNIKFALRIAVKYNLHLDFHIDYNLEPGKLSTVSDALAVVRSYGWPSNKTIVFGHCTRLTLYDTDQWLNLSKSIQDLPISFIGLPTSDIFMMGRPSAGDGGGQRPRGTLQVPQMIQEYNLNAAIGVNNVGNAFTPQGSCDPLSLASFGVGIYQAGTKEDADVLLVSPSGLVRG